MTPTFFALVVLVAGLLSSSRGVLTWQIVLCLFGGSAALSLPALGGASISPAVAFLPFMMTRAFLLPGAAARLVVVPRAGFWLLLTVLWGLLGAYYLPRLFAGETMVLTVDRTGSVVGPAMFPLRSVSGNITQAGYALGAVGAFFAIRTLLMQPGGMERFRDAVLLLSALNCLAAALNLGEFYAGFPPLLPLVRNAGYAIFGSYEEAGLVRIQGTFPETSGFCGFTLPLYGYTFSLWLNKVRPLYSGTTALLSLTFLLLSTSGTAYFGLAVYSIFAVITLLGRGLERRQVPRARALLIVILLVVSLVLVAMFLELKAISRIVVYLQDVVVGKMDSKSGAERSSWNIQAWTNFVETYGLGVGLGSARASSIIFVLLSNLGAIGTALFVGFLASVLRPRPMERLGHAHIASACRHAIVATLAANLAVATVFDLGVVFYSFAAACTVGAVRQSSPSRYRAAALEHEADGLEQA